MDSRERWVEKVHPRTRHVEPDDPMELLASPVPGDPAVMLECLIDEFVWIGCGAEELLAMFASPAYPVLNQLLGHFGREEVRRRVEERLALCGVVRFTETLVAGPDEPDDDEPPLLQLSLDRVFRHQPA